MHRLVLNPARSILRCAARTNARHIHSSRLALKPTPSTPALKPAPSSINPDEIAHFSRLSSQWWDESDGAEFALLHRMNPVRVRWILEKLEEARKDDANDEWTGWKAQPSSQSSKSKVGRQLEGMSVLDIGCGGGLLSEVCIASCSLTEPNPLSRTLDALSARGPHDRSRCLPIQHSYSHHPRFGRSFIRFGRESPRVQACKRRRASRARCPV